MTTGMIVNGRFTRIRMRLPTETGRLRSAGNVHIIPYAAMQTTPIQIHTVRRLPIITQMKTRKLKNPALERPSVKAPLVNSGTS